MDGGIDWCNSNLIDLAIEMLPELHSVSSIHCTSYFSVQTMFPLTFATEMSFELEFLWYSGRASIF